MKALARFLLTLLSAAVVVAFLSLDLDDTGPGPVTSVHAQVPELNGGRNCVACHGTGPSYLAGAAGAAQLAQACLDCHAPIATQVELNEGLHGKLDAAQQQLCGSCHDEHLGAGVELSGARSFRLAGLIGPEGFDHGTIDYQLDGRHAQLSCVDCHPHANKSVLAEGELRYLGRAQTCLECHEDVHEGKMKRGCEACHGQEHDFEDLSAFPHDARFPLHDSHGGLSCAECHEDGSQHSVAALSDPMIGQDPSVRAWRACASCHESPHSEDFLAGVPLPNPPPGPGRDGCALCHSEGHASWSGNDPVFESSWHAASGFGLDAPHDGLECSSCHARASGQSFLEAYPGRAADQCASCHQDVHQQQFDHPKYQEQSCLACHDRDRFAPHNFDLDAHASTRFELEQSHMSLACEACHDAFLPALTQPQALAPHADPCRIFRGTGQACEACHEDAHRGAFSALEAELGHLPQGNCARCHDAGKFEQPIAAFEHLRWTGFALELGHATESCEDCHARSALPDATGRRLGWVADLHPGDPAGCAGCHADVHAGAFAGAHLPAAVAGRIGCDRCHTVAEFQALHQAFDHAAWTGFALEGAHQQAACTTCHGSGISPRSFGFVADHYPGDANRCVSCHASPHDGVFEREGLPSQIQGRSDCARCHETRSFQAAALGAFDHGYWTGFALQGKHGLAQCNACHTERKQPTAKGRSYERAAGRDCLDCHADPHLGQFAQKGKTDCLSCHAVQAESWSLPGFDHSSTRFALDASHAKLACADCHPSTPVQGGGSAVRYKPLGTACADCHAVLPGPVRGGGK